ncbi:hypothetical protein JCM11641_004048 [Rhodosporidiobolus odoratus]
MFEVLSHCGVPTSAFRLLLRNQITTGLEAFFHPPSTAALLYHVEKTSGVLEDRTMKARMAADPSSVRASGAFDARDEEDREGEKEEESGKFVLDRRLDPCSGAPNTVAEVVVEMLHAGFDPADNPHLADKVHKVAQSWIQKQISWKVEDEYSRTAFVIADHLGVLEAREFFYQSSDPLPSPNGQGYTSIVLGPALLSRSPAIQPCDIQKWTGIFRPEYCTIRDVVIVSAKGERAACSILSGGDYDGDKLVICTNPSLVDPFNPALADPSFADPPFKDSDWFEVDRRKVKDVVAPLVQAGGDEQLSVIFMEGLWQGTQYGVISTWHTTLAYKLGLADSLTSEVGHLFCRALDGRKQGLAFSESKWLQAKKRFFEPHRTKPSWTYLEDGGKVPGGVHIAVRPPKMGKHAMNELVAEAWDLAVEDVKLCKSGAKKYSEDLLEILRHVRRMKDEYTLLRQTWMRDRELKEQTTRALQCPGSPTKSPSKQKGVWKASSRSQKEDLLELTRRFWEILDEGRMKSLKLQGRDGLKSVRALVASCAYIDFLRPTAAPLAPGATPFLNKLRAIAPSPSRTPSISTVLSATSTVVTTPSHIALSRTSTIITVPSPAPPAPAPLRHRDSDGDDIFHDAEDSFDGDDDFSYSQVADTASQAVAAARANTSSVFSSTSTSQTLAAQSTYAASSSHPSGPPSPTPVVAPPLPVAAFPGAIEERRGLLAHKPSFADACKKAEIKFCFDMAHRDVLALKADAETRRLYGGSVGGRGIQASKVAPGMLDCLSVSKRSAGLTKARARVRPLTLLTTSDEATGDSAGPSPAKKARRE